MQVFHAGGTVWTVIKVFHDRNVTENVIPIKYYIILLHINKRPLYSINRFIKWFVFGRVCENDFPPHKIRDKEPWNRSTNTLNTFKLMCLKHGHKKKNGVRLGVGGIDTCIAPLGVFDTTRGRREPYGRGYQGGGGSWLTFEFKIRYPSRL